MVDEVSGTGGAGECRRMRPGDRPPALPRIVCGRAEGQGDRAECRRVRNRRADRRLDEARLERDVADGAGLRVRAVRGIDAARGAAPMKTRSEDKRMRIFVFRPPAAAERSAAALRVHGHEPVLAPLFAVSRLPEPAPEGPFAALVLTSGNAVPALADLPPACRGLPVFTVGARSAAKVREAGFADARSADGNRHALIGLIGDSLAAPARLLLIVGRDRHDDVGERLTEAGFLVTVWEAYAAQAVAAFPEAAVEALRQGRVEGALHYSARGVQTCLALAREAGVAEALLDLTHVTL
ncbi:MAG: uroporphyrinogen-III synthase, partial [Alsobacter sp.]